MPILCEIVLEFWKALSDKEGGFKLAMGPYCRQHKRTASFFSSLPLAQSIFLRNRWMMPSHKFWVLLCTLGVFYRHYMPQSVYNKTQSLCMGSTKMCLLITRHILVLQLGRRKANSTKWGPIADLTLIWFRLNITNFKFHVPTKSTSGSHNPG
jgi:hypothetical protein